LGSVTSAIEATDERTFEIRLRERWGLVIETLAKASTPAFIMPERIAMTPPNTQVTETIGSGPFIFVRDEWRPGNRVVYRRNPDYVPRAEPAEAAAGGKHVHFDRLELIWIPDGGTAAAALQTGLSVEDADSIRTWALADAEGVPLASAAAWFSLVKFGVVAKWVLLGRVRPGQHGLWSCWCSRWDYLYVLWWFSARIALARVEGTPFLNMALRSVGTKIGRDVLIGPGATQIVDPDMLSFGDGSTVACHFQAHSFEDRILKIDHVRIEAGANAAENAVVFYGARIEEGATLESGSVLMKRGVVPAGTTVMGAPVG
jgi:acetyltransferase-like isoleucine patch superfamily enzyme